MSQPNENRYKLIICIECLNVNYYGHERCSDCGNIIILSDRTAIIDECGKTLFYAYQNRRFIELLVESTPVGIPIPKGLQAAYDEIFNFIVMAILGGVTYDAIKFFLIKIKKSLKRKEITLRGITLKSGLTVGEELLEKLADDEALEEFIRYINEYKNGLDGVHNEVLSETLPLNMKVIEENQDMLKLLAKSIDEKKEDESKSQK